MGDPIETLYKWSISKGHIPAELPFEKFAAKVGNESGMKAYYDKLASVPKEGSEYGAAGSDWAEFSAAYLQAPKKKEYGFGDLSSGSPTSSSLPSVAAPNAQPSSAPDQAPWQQVIDSTQPAPGPKTFDSTDPEAYKNVGTQPRETAGFGKPLTGDEDPFEVAESLRSTLPNYEYRKTYESKTTLRKLGRDMENLSVYGQQARQQTQAAEKRLTEKFGHGWEGGLENMVTMMGQMKPDPEKVNVYSQESVDAYNRQVSEYQKIQEQYNKVVGDPDFQEYQNGLKAQNKGYEAFKAYQERPEIKEKMARAAASQARSDFQGRAPVPEMLQLGLIPGQGGGTQNWAMRKGAQILGGVMALPRTVSGALPDSWTSKKWEIADELASMGDELVESANISYPKPSQLTKPLYEKTVQFEGKTVVVDGKGNLKSVRDKDGTEIKNVDEAPEGGTSLAQRFKESGKSSEASLDWNGSVAATLDKTLDAAADLMIYRYLGQGTKAGVVASSMAMSHQQAYTEAIEQQKMNPQDAAEYAFFSSLGNGMLEAYLGNIETAFAKPGVAAAVQLGKKEALSLAGKATAAQRAYTALKPVLKEIGGENAEEITQAMYSDMTRAAYNKMTGAEMEMEMSKESLAETALITTLVTAPAAMMGMGANANQYRMSALMAAVKDPARFDTLMDEFAGNGVVDETQAAMLKAKIGQLAAYNQNLPAAMSVNDRAHVLALQEYRDSQARIAESDKFVEAQRQQARQEVKQTDEIINEIVTKATGVKGQEVAPEQQAVTPVNMPAQQPLPTSEDVAKPVEGAFPPDATVESLVTPAIPADVATPEDIAAQPTVPIEDQVAQAAVEALRAKGMEVTPEIEAEVREFVVPEMTQPEMINNPAEPANQAIDRLTTEFMVEKGVEIKPVKSVEQLKEYRKAAIEEMDSSLDEIGQADVMEFTVKTGAKFSQIAEAIQTNAPAWQELQQINPSAADIVQQAVDKIVPINEEIRNAERVSAQEPGQPGPLPGQTDAAPVQNQVQDNTGVEVGEVEVGVGAENVQPGDTVDAAEQLATKTPKSQEDAVSMSKDADATLAEAPLPDKPDESNVAQLVASGSIEPETAALALSDLPGAEAAGEEVMAAMDGIKKDMTGERADEIETGNFNDMATAHSPEEVLERPAFVETDSEFIVTRSTHIRDILRDMGGKWTPGRGWVFPMKMKEQVLAAINRPVNPPRDMAEKHSPGLAGRLGAAMRNSTVYRLASQRRNRIAKGKSLEERLKIAQEEIRIGSDERVKRLARVSERLQKAFPGIEVVSDPAEFAAAAKKAFPDAATPPAGFVVEGKVYYDIERAGIDTPIHEFGHIWNTLMATHFPEQHARGLETMRGSEYEAAVREDTRYATLDDAGVLDEALALAIGERGARIMNASRWERFQEFLDDVWMGMKRLLKTDPFQFTAQQYADYAAAKLLSGEELFPETSEEIARIEKQAKAMFIGEFAQMSDQARDDLDMARRMEERGHSNEDTWMATNWRRAVDGKWKFEIADKDARIIIMPALINTGEVWSLDEVMQHDRLLEAYPSLRNMPVVFIHQPAATYVAAVATDNKTGGMTILINRAKVDNLKSSLLHEVQHLIQKIEGFNYPIPVGDRQDSMITKIQDLSLRVEQAEGEEKQKLVGELESAVDEFRGYYVKQSAEVEARNVQFRENFDDRGIRAVFPEKTEDVAREEQVVLFGVEKPKTTTPGFEQPGELLEGTTPYARAHFGSEELRNAATRNAAQQLIEIEIQQGGDRDMAIPQIASALGLDEAFVDQMWNEADARVGKKAVRIDATARGQKTIAERIKRATKRQFSYNGLLPRDVFHDAQKMEQNINSILYMAEKQGQDLEKAIVAYIKAREQRMSRKAQQDFRQLVNNAMNGQSDWSLVPDDVPSDTLWRSIKWHASFGTTNAQPTSVIAAAKVLRTTIDRLSRELLLSGAFPKTAIVTVMENMGVTIDNSVDGSEFSVAVSALSKPPYERTDEENLFVDAFLEKHQQAFGTYLNRSYRVHSYPDWINRIPQDVWNRAKQFYLKQFADRRAELEQIVGRNDEKNAVQLEQLNTERDQVKSLIEGIVTELEAKVDAIDVKTSFPRPPDANVDLDDLGDTVDSIRDFIGKVREELQRIGNISNAEMVELDSMIGPNAQALSGYMRQLRSLNDEIDVLELKMEKRIEDAAKELDILNNNMANIDRFMRQELIEQQKSLDVLMTGGQLGAKPTTVTKKRKDIPEEIRALYGEYKDPVINFTQSVMKMAQLLESQKFLNQLRSRYEGVYFFKDGKQSADADTRIAAEGNARMAPLDGWYTTPDIAQAMKDFYSAEEVDDWQKFWGMYVVNYIKLGKTILSPVTQARNFWGNVSFMVANGWNPARMFQAWQEYGDFWNKMEPGKWREYAAKLHKLGVFGNSVNAKDIENMRNVLGMEDAPKEEFGAFVDNRIMSYGKKFATLPKTTFGVAQKLYEMGDGFYKLMGFENEKRRYAQAWFGRPFDELSTQQQAEVEARAAHIVKSVLPTYSYVPRIVKTLRRMPFVGTFVAFPAEMIRVTYNGYALAIEEMKDPRTRSFGVRRMMGYNLALTASYGLVQVFKALFGYDDDEWDDANKFVSEFQKNAMLLPLPRDKNGNMRYVNMSYTDPFSFLAKTVNAGFDDPTMPPAGRAVSMFKEMTSPFLSPELSFWTFMQLAMNVDDRGKPIRSIAYEDEVFDSQYVAEKNLERQFEFARKKLQPGIIKSLWDAYDIAHINADKSGRIKEWSDFLIGHAFGLNIERIDPKVSYEFSMKALMDERNAARAGYTATQGQLNRAWDSLEKKFDEMTPAEVATKTKEFDKTATDRLKAEYEVSKSAYLRILKEGHETTTALMRLGASEKEVRAILKSAKFGQKNNEINAIISGKYDSVILQFKKKEKY